VTDEPQLGFGRPRFPAQVDVRLDPSLADRAPFDLPLEPNTWLRAGAGSEVLWLGPDRWLVVAEMGPDDGMVAEPGIAGAIASELDRALAGYHRSVIDATANLAAMEAWGYERREVLANGCGIDLHPRSWREGMCAQTLLARIPVILQERTASTRVFVRPSYAASLMAWLFDLVGTVFDPR
jgi:sarcosine oxidase subunit gamma